MQGFDELMYNQSKIRTVSKDLRLILCNMDFLYSHLLVTL